MNKLFFKHSEDQEYVYLGECKDFKMNRNVIMTSGVIFPEDVRDKEIARHMNLVWSHCTPIWERKCDVCIPQLDLKCCFHSGYYSDVAELDRMYQL